MSLTLLQLVDQASGELGLTQPTLVIGTAVAQTLQMLALTQRVGRDLIREFDWRWLVREQTFSTVNGTQDYAVPSDFDRMVSETTWDRTDFWPVPASATPQQWQVLKSAIIAASIPPFRGRLYGSNFRVDPVPTAAYSMVYEYVSNLWVFATAGTTPTKSSFSVDSDFCVFPDDLMLAGIKYYFLRAKGLDYGPMEQDFYRILGTRKAQDVPVPSQSLGGTPTNYLDIVNVPEGNWTL